MCESGSRTRARARHGSVNGGGSDGDGGQGDGDGRANDTKGNGERDVSVELFVGNGVRGGDRERGNWLWGELDIKAIARIVVFFFFLFRSRSHDIILNSNLSGLHSYPFISFSVMCGRLVMPSLKPVVI